MTAIRELTRVKPDGSIELRNAALPAGEDVEVIVLMPSKKNGEGESYAFLKILEDARLEGPPDWSEKVEEYLRGGRSL